ncbi:MAG TPA: CCA tRNA nucleotidyltransferase [Verrucomicrobiota bacterium]|nr:CCA tRNA nucleotidyltransferase [Verrucomicrobiota bacterium]HQL77254.1 CCA tRNA nucleotidyltransferase [Verrucomicrobiota bacterium]
MTAQPANLPRTAALDIVRRLQKAGFPAFWVGGCVRDFLLGRDPGDYDIATAALPEQVERLFKRTIAVGRKFGVMVVVEKGCQFQLATFRAEADYQDGRHPGRVAFGDARADALRRDFTVNGLFYDPVRRQLHDWVGGEADLRAKVVRTIGSPDERFAEDHLRLLRAVRFAAQLDFTIEAGTFAALQANAPRLKGISAERIREELVKLFQPPHASRGLELLRQSGLLEQVLPEIAATVACLQSPDFHPEGAVFDHLRLMLQHLPPHPDPALPWAVLLHDVAKPLTASTDPKTGSIHFYGHEKLGAEMAGAILERLRFPRKQIEAVVKATRYHMQFKDVRQMRKSTLRRLLLRPTFPLELALHRLDCLGSHGLLDVYDFLVAQAGELEQKPQIRPPLLTGHDLIALGMQPGPALGALLAEIREMQLQDELTTKAAARKWAKTRIAKGPPAVQ